MSRHIRLLPFSIASASWLNFDESSRLDEMEMPFLFIVPKLDETEIGIERHKAQAEVDRAKTGHILFFDETGEEDHTHVAYAPDEFVEAVAKFLEEQVVASAG